MPVHRVISEVISLFYPHLRVCDIWQAVLGLDCHGCTKPKITQ